MPILAWMITFGRWNLLQSGFLSDFYDAQARALFHGHWNVPPSVVQIEGFVVKGRTYEYYGPLPALIRMPVLLVTSRLDGRLTELSILLAMLVTLICTSRLAWKIRNLVSSASVSVREAVLVAFSVIVVATGSVFVFLANTAIVYHEAEAWGAALALAAFDALVGFLQHPSRRGVVVTGVLATLDLLTRGSVGLGPVAALGFLAVLHGAVSFKHRGRFARGAHGRARLPATAEGEAPRRWAWIGIPDATAPRTRAPALLCATAAALGVYLLVNYMKFGTLYSIPWRAQVALKSYPQVRAALAANGGSLLGLKFVPTALLQYLRPDAIRGTGLFPFIGFPPAATVLGHVVYEYRNPASSVTSTMPAFLVAGAVGVWSAFRRPRRGQSGRRTPGGVALLRVPLLGALVGTFGSLEIAYIAERYLADWMPLLVLAALVGVAVLVERGPRMRPWARRTILAAGCLLAVFGVVVNLTLSIVYQRELNPFHPPTSVRAQFVNLQLRIDRDLSGNPGDGVTEARRLPAIAPAGDLVILGNCAALYQSTGTDWEPVEQSQAGGAFELRVTFDPIPGRSSVYQPLVVTGSPGAGDFVAVRAVGPDRVRFAYLYGRPIRQRLSRAWSEGQAVDVRPGHPYLVNVVLDPNTEIEQVTLDGMLVASGIYVREPTNATFGVDTIHGPTATSFGGRVDLLPSPTPICDALKRRIDAAHGHTR